MAGDDGEDYGSRSRRGSRKSNGGGGGKKLGQRNSSGDTTNWPKHDSSDTNSMGGGRYTEHRLQDEGPLSPPLVGDEIRMSPQLSVGGSDGGGDDKGMDGGWSVCTRVEEPGGVEYVDRPVGQADGGDGGGSDGSGGGEASKAEWTDNAIREMDSMRAVIERRNSANEMHGFNATQLSSSSEVSHPTLRVSETCACFQGREANMLGRE